MVLGDQVDVRERAKAIAQRLELSRVSNSRKEFLANRTDDRRSTFADQFDELTHCDVFRWAPTSQCEGPNRRIDEDVHERRRCRL